MSALGCRPHDCDFCTRTDQPPILFETRSLYVMPDRYPILPGHTLIITKEHRRCYGTAPLDLLTELNAATTRVGRFIRETYGRPALAWENGDVGQTVFHAHLHLFPCQIETLPPDVEKHADVTEIDGWDRVRQHFARHGHYRYVGLSSRRRLIDGLSPEVQTGRRILAEATGLEWSPRGWNKTTTPDDVLDVSRRMEEWQQPQTR